MKEKEKNAATADKQLNSGEHFCREADASGVSAGAERTSGEEVILEAPETLETESTPETEQGAVDTENGRSGPQSEPGMKNAVRTVSTSGDGALAQEKHETGSTSGTESTPEGESAPAQDAGGVGKKANPNRKKLIALIVTAGVVLAILAAVLIAGLVRNRRPPALEDIRARVEELVLASREVNEIFFGEGLPSYARIYLPDYTLGKYQTTYNGKEYNRSYYVFTDHEGRWMIKYQYCLAAGLDTDGDGKADRYEYPDLEFGGFLTVEYVNDYRYAEIFFEKTDGAFYEGETKNAAGETVPCFLVRRDGYTEPFYYTAEDDLYYDYVTEDCAYQSIDEIKALAGAVYSAEYLASVYESIFTGITVSDRDSGTLFARYAEVEMEDGFLYLMKSNRTEPLNVKRVYDFSTMKMVKPSNSTYVTVEMETYLEGDEANRLAVRVALVYENGQWMLDSPTY